MKYKMIATATVAVFALAGCGVASSEPAPVVTVTKSVPVPAAPAPVTTSDDEYIALIYSVRPDMISTYGEGPLIEVGHSFCEFVRNGHTISEYGEIAIGVGLSTNDAATIAAAAFNSFCTDMNYLIS